MEEWEIDTALVGKELPAFDEKLKLEIFLTKFKAVIAKKILLVSRDKNVDAEILLDGVRDWIKNFSEVDTNEKR